MPAPVQAPVHARSPSAAALIAAAALLAAARCMAGVEPPSPATAPVAAPAAPQAAAPADVPAEGAHGAAAVGGPILCSEPPGPVALGSAQWNGWGRGVENTRYQPEPAIRATDVSRLALKWAFGYPGANTVSGQPTIVDGRVFAAGAGAVYALDARTGCTYWRFDTDGHAFSAIAIAEFGAPRLIAKPKKAKRGTVNAHLEVLKAPSAALFGDDKGAVFALDAERGTLLWKTQLESEPGARILGAPAVYQNRLYVAVGSSESGALRDAASACCTFRGSIAALDIASGRVVWKTYLVNDEPKQIAGATGGRQFGPAGIAVEGAPTLDTARGLVYAATGDSFNPALQPLADAVVALDLLDGKVRWSKQLAAPASEGGGPSDFLASPILRTLTSGRQVLLAGQRSGLVYSLDPERSGEILWQLKGPENKAAGGIESGMAVDHRSVYAAISGRGVDAANPTGSLISIDIKTGTKRWQTAAPPVACSWSGASACSHGEAQAVTVIPGAAFSGSLDGHLRAYSTIDGKIVWDYDTAKEFATVNRVKAGGGSLDQGGATIVNGVVYVNSGSERGSPGNVLLAFSVDGK
jgi:polyvinyl alcohol dehydrogenase (cytochrome)